jgi:xylulose-5-phosphate/fructose-6-phosphate phosphoketolase
MDLNVIYICGPGHGGGPGMVANTYLEGSYSEIYPDVSRTTDGMRHLFRQFSFPGGIPSHAAPETPGSIHEGGELGYALMHAYGAAFDNPDLILADHWRPRGIPTSSSLRARWRGSHDLHLNGCKIASPTVLGRMDDEEIRQLFSGYGHEPLFVEGDDQSDAPANGRRTGAGN